MGERLHASHLLENFILFASLGLCVFRVAKTAYYPIVASLRPVSNRFPKIGVLPDEAPKRLPEAGQTAQKGADLPGREGGFLFGNFRVLRLPGRKTRRNSKKTVDISKKIYIISASMIEARMSRVRLPKVQEPGRGKGASAEASSSRLREPGPGRGENIPRTVTSFGGGALSWIHTRVFQV